MEFKFKTCGIEYHSCIWNGFYMLIIAYGLRPYAYYYKSYFFALIFVEFVFEKIGYFYIDRTP